MWSSRRRRALPSITAWWLTRNVGPATRRFLAGEVTNHFNPLLGRAVRIESWQVAENQSAVAAANMLGGESTYAETPWLWSDQYDCNLQTLGIFGVHQTMVTRGDPACPSFSILALGANGKLEAVAAANCGRDVAACRREGSGQEAPRRHQHGAARIYLVVQNVDP